MAKADVLVTAGMLADKLRPMVLASGPDADDTVMVGVHRGTLGAIYQHLERLAAMDGETTDGARQWAKQSDRITIDGQYRPELQLNGGYSAVRYVEQPRSPANPRGAVERFVEGWWRGGVFHPVFWATKTECAVRCDYLNVEAARKAG